MRIKNRSEKVLFTLLNLRTFSQAKMHPFRDRERVVGPCAACGRQIIDKFCRFVYGVARCKSERCDLVVINDSNAKASLASDSTSYEEHFATESL